MDAPGVADVEADWFADSGGWASIEAASSICKVVGSELTMGRNGVNCDGSAIQGSRQGMGSRVSTVTYVVSSRPDVHIESLVSRREVLEGKDPWS